MKKIVIVQPVTVKTVITEKLKIDLTNELNSLLKELEMEIDYLKFMVNRVSLDIEKKPFDGLTSTRDELNAEKIKNQDRIKRLKENLEAVKMLKIGDEIVKSTVERMLTVEIGDKWNEPQDIEIILEDDIVTDIRGINSTDE